MVSSAAPTTLATTPHVEAVTARTVEVELRLVLGEESGSEFDDASAESAERADLFLLAKSATDPITSPMWDLLSNSLRTASTTSSSVAVRLVVKTSISMYILQEKCKSDVKSCLNVNMCGYMNSAES